MVQTIEKLVENFAIISNAFLAEQLQQSGEENKGKRSVLTFSNYKMYPIIFLKLSVLVVCVSICPFNINWNCFEIES